MHVTYAKDAVFSTDFYVPDNLFVRLHQVSPTSMKKFFLWEIQMVLSGLDFAHQQLLT